MPVKETNSSFDADWIALPAILAGAFLINLDVFILNVAIPTLQRDLRSSLEAVEMVVVGYTVTYGALLVLSGRLGEIFGHKKMYLWGLAAFGIASVLCGSASDASTLIIYRLIQGGAAALVMPQVFSLIQNSFQSPRSRVNAYALLGATFGLSTIGGQITGGYLLGADPVGLGWRLIFLINIPIAALAFIVTTLLVNEAPVTKKPYLDVFGSLLACGALLVFFFGLDAGKREGWTWPTIAAVAVSLVGLFLFVKYEVFLTLSDKTPLVDMRIFSSSGFSIGLASVLLLYSTLAPFNLFLVVYLQNGLGLSALQAGSSFTFAAAPFMLSSLLVGWLSNKWGFAIVLVGAGLVLVSTAGLAVALLSGFNIYGGILFTSLVLMGVGYGLLETPLLNAVLSRAPEHGIGMVSGAVNTVRQIGTSLGITFVGGIFVALISSGYDNAFLSTAIYQVVIMSVLLVTSYVTEFQEKIM